jgi:small subunit ribosomal protein S4e
MAKKGKTHHLKRLAVPSHLPIRKKKHKVFLVSPNPGPHKKSESLALAVLLRDELQLCDSFIEAKKIIKQRHVYVDGRVSTDPKRPIGFMDVIYIKPLNKYWRMEIVNGKLKAVAVNKLDFKYGRVVKKLTIKKGKISIGLHDGKTLLADNSIKVGDTLKISLPDYKILKTIKLAPGALCIIFRGKHKGKLGKLQSIIEQKGSMGSIAFLKDMSNKELRTSLDYLMVIDEEKN